MKLTSNYSPREATPKNFLNFILGVSFHFIGLNPNIYYTPKFQTTQPMKSA
nr:MAG TPA: hypothetical protein [Caudoviricetes sp.]